MPIVPDFLFFLLNTFIPLLVSLRRCNLREKCRKICVNIKVCASYLSGSAGEDIAAITRFREISVVAGKLNLLRTELTKSSLVTMIK